MHWLFWRHRRRHRHHHHCHPNRSPVRSMLGITRLQLTVGNPIMSTVTLTATVPTTRKSGASLSLSEIARIELSRNGQVIDSLVPTGPTVTFTDNSPLTGNDDYNVETLTTDGFISDPSNTATVTIATADPAAAITDLTATVNP